MVEHLAIEAKKKDNSPDRGKKLLHQKFYIKSLYVKFYIKIEIKNVMDERSVLFKNDQNIKTKLL